jgi:hypothetical protein
MTIARRTGQAFTGGGMQVATPLIPSSQKSDPQVLKQWAAEDFAISVGLLRECPYHGQPYKPARTGLSTQGFTAELIDLLHPAVQIFKGDTTQLLAAVKRVVRDYGDRCVYCAASDQEEEFD